MITRRLAVAILFCTASAHAVLRTQAIGDDVDTLSLYPGQARDFYIKKNVGEDLQNLTVALGVAAGPAVYAAHYFARRQGDRESPFYGLDNSAYLFSYLMLPALSSLMACGNLVYGQSASYDDNREYALNRSLLPILAFSITATKLLIYLPNPRLERFDGLNLGLVTAYGFSELFTFIALRRQFLGARAFVENLQIKVVADGQSLGIKADF